MIGLERGTIGVWCSTDGMDAPTSASFAADLLRWGYTALWIPETLGRDPFAHIANLATREPELTFATGIANIHHRHPGAMVQGAQTLAELTGRFTLGLGVSHAPFVEGLRGTTYTKPIATMTAYLDAMDSSPYIGPPAEPAPRVLAALGPRMLKLAAERTDGALTYWTTPEHTTTARSILGPHKALCVEQKVVLTDDRSVAHDTARAALSIYDGLPNYRNHWLRIGFTESEIDGRAPRFLDAVVAWGSADQIAGRIEAHRQAGADHVCIQPLSPSSPFVVDAQALAALAPNSR